MERGLFVSAEEEELGVVRGAMFDVEEDEVQTGSGPLSALVSAIPLHLVYARVQRRVHECAHSLALNVVDS